MKHFTNNMSKRPFLLIFLIIIIFLFIIIGIYSTKEEMPNRIKGEITKNKTNGETPKIPERHHLYGPTSDIGRDPSILPLPEIDEHTKNHETAIKDEIPSVLEYPLINPLIRPPFKTKSAEFTDNNIEETTPPPPAPESEIKEQTEKILENIHDRPKDEEEPSFVQPPEEIPKKYKKNPRE